jgi:tetratricopeptide (TPR) repeat protein
MNNVANSYYALGRHALALKFYEEVLAWRKSNLGPDHPDTLKSMSNLASIFHTLGRHADALKLLKETLAMRKAKLGSDHPETLASMINLANSYAAVGRRADALNLREETLALQKAKLGADHPDTLLSMNNLADSYYTLGRHADALKLNEETLALLKTKLGADHPDTLFTMANLAECLVALDRRSEAVAIIDDCLRRANGKTVDPRLLPVVLNLRLRVFAKQKDASGCRQTAEMWERLARNDADSLYKAACFRAVTAGVLPAASQTPDADQAMGWLTKAVAAGHNKPQHVARMIKDSDLDALRNRQDFRRLLTELFDRGFPGDPFAK